LNSEVSAQAAAELENLRLVHSLKAGDEAAYEELILRFQQSVYTLALRLLGNEAEASDVTQDVFVKVFRSIRSFRGQSSLRTWIYRITVNEAQNARRWFFRHRGREVGIAGDSEDARDWTEAIADTRRSPFEMVCDQEQQILIEAALQTINPVFREAVVLRDITDLSYEDIAEILGVSLGTVKSRILRGREALRERLAGTLERRPALRLVPNTAE
jgi:RNA polymerase sigma-70 factor (ECF subfamily)